MFKFDKVNNNFVSIRLFIIMFSVCYSRNGVNYNNVDVGVYVKLYELKTFNLRL